MDGATNRAAKKAKWTSVAGRWTGSLLSRHQSHAAISICLFLHTQTMTVSLEVCTAFLTDSLRELDVEGGGEASWSPLHLPGFRWWAIVVRQSSFYEPSLSSPNIYHFAGL